MADDDHAELSELSVLVAESNWLRPGLPMFVARAPGRLDVLGGIADYSGALVLEMPIARAAYSAVQRAPGRGELRVVSLAAAPGSSQRQVILPWSELLSDDDPSHRLSGGVFRRRGAAWCGYVGGCLRILSKEHGAIPNPGEDVTIVLRSDVPEGRGLSSSAAIEVATMTALAGAFGVAFEPATLALACQRVENLVVGAPCGLMDQITVASGRANALSQILCQPDRVLGLVPLPSELTVWGIDSGVRHSVLGKDYAIARAAAFMGYRMLLAELGVSVEAGQPGHVAVEDPPWGGYLANLERETAERLLPRLPETMDGRRFLERHQGVTDPLTEVDPGASYPVRAATRHPIEEHRRALEFSELLTAGPGEQRAQRLGALLRLSHESYTECGLGSSATDRVVELVASAGAGSGLFGARVTGGGSGGTVVVIGRPDADAAVREIAARYRAERGEGGTVISGSSDGALHWGCRKK